MTEDLVADVEAALDPEVTALRHALGIINSYTLAKALGINEATLRAWRTAHRGPDYVLIGKRVWYLFADVENWLERSKTMAEQRRDYSKMTTNENDVQAAGPKRGTHVEQPQEPPPTPEEVNAPPKEKPQDDAEVVPPSTEEVDEAWRHKEHDQFDRKVPPDEEDGSTDEAGGGKAA